MEIEEPLKFLDPQNWKDLQETFKKDWPRHILGYNLLEIETKWTKLGLDYGFKVYCPFGDVKNGMVGFNIKKGFYELIIQSGNIDTSKLEEALLKTKLINWQQDVMVAYAPEHIIRCLKAVVPKIGARIDFIYPSNTFIALKDNEPYKDITPPKKVTFKKLSETHVNTVNSVWPYKYDTSEWYFSQIIQSGLAYGLFEDQTLAAFVVINEAGNLCNLFTLNQFRRKGYAELLMKYVCNEMLELGMDTIAYCMDGNAAALELYKKLGFKLFEDVAWVYIKPN